MPADGDTVITPAQLKAGQDRKRQQQKHRDAADPHRTELVSNIWAPTPCGVCAQPVWHAQEAVLPRIDGKLEPRHRSCHVGAEQLARMGGSAT